jgi:FlaA1/EpsC-like NDP-sugar epimerase
LPSRLLVRFRKPVLLGFHLALIPASYFGAFVLRFDLPLPPDYLAVFYLTVVLLVPIRLLIFAVFGLFQGWWRHVGMQDLMDLLKAVSVSSAVFAVALFFTGSLAGVPRSILVLDWLLALTVFGGGRFVVRALREGRPGWITADRRATPALVIGAGEAAERLLRQLRLGGAEFRAVGLVDDDPAKRGMRMHGVAVIGSTEELGRIVQQCGATLLVIAIPSAGREDMQRIVSRCLDTGVEFKIVPSLIELLDGRARVSQLRSVEVADLLGRDCVETDLTKVHTDLAGEVVLITGAAGSIGSELARQVAHFRPCRLILLDQAESPLYFTHLELDSRYPDLEIVPVVADITEGRILDRVFAEHRPSYVFHAAAYKHVPMMEMNPLEAVRNNVQGTLELAECAVRSGVGKFILISTDKAVNPSSVMGATKRVAERIVLGWPALMDADTDFRAVRFGNVLGSDGSVIPLFKKQLDSGGPLTVTDPEVSRYFMTIPEAVQLVLQAAAIPEAGGCITMLEMGEPVRIVELAENLIRLSGLEPYRDVPIVFTGLRQGEKLHEELISFDEATFATSVEKIRVVRTGESDGRFLQAQLERLRRAVAIGDRQELLAALGGLVPECVPPLSLVARSSSQEPAAESKPHPAAALPVSRPAWRRA